MKSFVAYPLEIEKNLLSGLTETGSFEEGFAHYELLKKVAHLHGSIVKCGIAAEDGIERFIKLTDLIATRPEQQVIAFEKLNKGLYLDKDGFKTSVLQPKENGSRADTATFDSNCIKKDPSRRLTFISGNIEDSIPQFLIENPELKLSCLNIDLDDYEKTYTTLQYFYPRLVYKGILIIDSYYKQEEDYAAVNDYFKHCNVLINNFSVNKGPHYLVRK